MSHNTPEPMPVRMAAGPSIWELVIEDMRERDRVGFVKYGGPLVANDGRRSLVDAYQEALDLAVYLKKELVERDGTLKHRLQISQSIRKLGYYSRIDDPNRLPK